MRERERERERGSLGGEGEEVVGVMGIRKARGLCLTIQFLLQLIQFSLKTNVTPRILRKGEFF